VIKVDELINPVSGTWDEDLINDLFWPVDAHRILQIPLTHGKDDLVAWHYNRNGLFSVRSAYHVQWIHKFVENRVNEKASGCCRRSRSLVKTVEAECMFRLR
jgi:hypothetical protein